MAIAVEAVRQAGLRSACLGARQWLLPQPDDVLLQGPTGQAVADLLPLLLCGEASAEFVFSNAASQLPATSDPGLRSALQGIADDERQHEVLLSALRDRLPPPSRRLLARRAVRFLRHLVDADLAVHLTRVAALDAGVCQVLAEISRPGTPIAASAALKAIFWRIRSDEGRHVRVSRRCAAALGISAERELIERNQVLRNFAELLAPTAASFSLLGGNLNRVTARLIRVGMARAPATHRTT